MSKHTPGPWTAHDHNVMREFGDDPKDWIGYAWVEHGGDARGKFQGKVADLDRRRDGSEEFRVMAAADARLIAAAPDLLEALRMMLVQGERCHWFADRGDEEVCQQARDAIAKAT